MTTDDVEVYESVVDPQQRWWLLLVLGIVSVIIGGFLMFNTGSTLSVITAIVGLFMIIAGLVRFFVAVFDSAAPHRWAMAFVGIIGVVIGVIIMKNPESTIKVIVLITAIFWIIGGMVDFFGGIIDSGAPDRGLRIGFGALSAMFGAVILMWPDITVGVFAILMGMYIVFFGILEIVAAFQIKNA